MFKTRFAPSPTGALHLGHAWSALQAHDAARAAGGTMLLRIEDIDGTRSRPEHVAGILADLEWLGIEWDGPVVYQSQRLDLYTAALQQLATGLVYPCFCTRADIAREVAASLSAPHGPDGALYPGTCRDLSERERGRRLATDPHCWRLDVGRARKTLGGKDLAWHDCHVGRVVAEPALHGDVVLARKDAPASYHLAVTVDDAAQGITHVVRGRDLFAATHIHRLLQALLGLPAPEYYHHALLTDDAGNRLAKRNNAPTLASLRENGMPGAELAQMLRERRLPVGFAIAKD